MAETITYRDQDITIDIMMKIEHVVTLIKEVVRTNFDEALITFTSTRTYQNIINTESLMWSESAEFILDEYLREKSLPKCGQGYV